MASNPIDGMTHLAVPKVHVQKINSSYKQVHSPSASLNLPKPPLERKVPLNKPRMPGKNPGVGPKFSI